VRLGGLISFVALIGAVVASACGWASASAPTYPQVSREAALPGDISKRGPENDSYPPILHCAEFETPVALPAPVNTRGAEDAPFILPDGRTLYFFFTPDARLPPEQQVLDHVSGVWVTHKVGGGWSSPERVWLQAPGKLALDGAISIQGDEMWFASAREGYVGANIFTAHWRNGVWADWEYSGDRLMKEIQIGEVHLQGDELYFHSDRAGGQGNLDLWVTSRGGEDWADPINLAGVNTPGLDGFPFVSADGSALWFTRTVDGAPAIFRALNIEGNWAKPELIVSQFAGEPSLDAAGNLYFVHHFFEDGKIIEADIYLARRR
jgi:hypothetical protein